MKKKLLVYVNSMNALGGIERVIANLTGGLSEYFDITILVKDKLLSAYHLADGIRMDTIDAKLTMNMDSRIQRILSVPFNIYKSIKMLKKWFKKNDIFDYVYTAFPTNGIEIYLSNRKLRDKLVASEHASYYAYNFVYKKMKEWLYPRIKVISVPTTMDTEIYQKLGYNAVYIPHLSTYVATENTNHSSKTAINVGRLTSDKQQLMLIEMWEEVNKCNPDNEWKLQIIGSGEEEHKLRSYIKEHDLKNVEMVPHTKKIADYYQNAGLFLFTSRMEGFGMVLLEAMSFGVPCISFDCPSGPRDIVKDGKNGYLVACYDRDMYIEKVCRFINKNINEQKIFREGALGTVKNWDNEKIIKQWVTLFERLEK